MTDTSKQRDAVRELTEKVLLLGDTGAVLAVAICLDSRRIVSGSSDKTLRV